MDIKMKLLVFAVDMICPLILGYACRYQHVLKDGFFNKMILNNILVVCPVVSFLSFWVMPIIRLTGRSWFVPAASFGFNSPDKVNTPSRCKRVFAHPPRLRVSPLTPSARAQCAP